MFEEEIKFEEKQSNIMPLLMVLTLIIGVAAVLGYFIMESRRTVSEDEALAASKASITAMGAQKVHFHVGFVKPSPDEQPFDPHYRLLEKAGFVKLGTPTYQGLDVKLTPAGEEMLQAAGAQPEKNKDGTTGYTVTLAERQLIKVARVEMISPQKAVVEYEWNWKPTALGLVFDANSPEMTKLPIYDAAVLMQKYGSTYYKESKVKTTAFTLLWDENNKKWVPAG
ncbi:MAG TPA: hypothetical protein VLA96_03530 [Terriglobales bacterium]|nr:hypothetical protein [Terriglobales bacterium]